MLAIFRSALSKSLGQMLGWSLSLGLLGSYVVSLHDTFAKQETRDQLMRLINSYPKELMAMFGGAIDMYTPAGYLNVEFFSYMPIILGVFAVLAGSGLLAADEEGGQLDLLQALAVSRAGLFFGRLAAFVVDVLVILFVVWLGFVLMLPATGLRDITPLQLSYPFFSLLGQLCLFGALSLLFSQVFPSRRLAAMASGMLLIGLYFLNSLGSMQESLQKVIEYLPLHYYQGARAIEGMQWDSLGWLLLVSALLSLLAWQVYERRDLRLGGEGGWRLPVMRKDLQKTRNHKETQREF